MGNTDVAVQVFAALLPLSFVRLICKSKLVSKILCSSRHDMECEVTDCAHHFCTKCTI